MKIIILLYLSLVCTGYYNRFHKFKSSSYILSYFQKSELKSSAPVIINDILNVTIQEVTNLGQGVAKYELSDGLYWIILVPYVISDEFVTIQIERNERTYSEGKLLNVIIPSKYRVIPACQYFGSCGGCQYQHIDIKYQRIMKNKQVNDLLLRFAGVKDINISVDDTIGTENSYNYRNKITPHYSVIDSKPYIGFQSNQFDEIIDIKDCSIATKEINNKYLDLRNELLSNGIENLFNTSVSSSFISNRKRYTFLLRDHDEGVTRNGNDLITQQVYGYKYQFIASDFFQNNIFILNRLIDYLHQQLSNGNPSIITQCKYLVDSYCGSGLFAIALSKLFKQVYGIEINEQAINQAKCNCELNNITNVNFFNGISQNIFQNIKHLPSKETVVLLDPPRKGCSDSFLKQLVNYSPSVIIYVSCDPLSQMGDIKGLIKKGYIIHNITPFDFFPHTRHIENVIILKLKSK